jgi:tetratricopeptide (TPR) repeat protein
MALASQRLIERLAAGSLLLAFAFTTAASARGGGGGGKGDAGACETREIAAAIRGCTDIIDNGHVRNAKLVQAYLNRGRAYAKRGSFAEAIADFEQAIGLNPSNAELYRERGDSYRARKETALAEEDFAAAIRLSPDDAKAYALRGWLRKTAGDEERAKADFEQAVKLADQAIAAKEDVAQAHSSRGMALAGLGDLEHAVAASDAVIKAKPEDEAAYSDRGFFYVLKGDKDRALADFNKALDLQPDYWQATIELGNLFIRTGDPAKAISEFDFAIELSKDNAQAYHNRAIAYRSKGDLDRAIADASEAIRLNANFAEAFSSRGTAYAAQKDNGRAIADFTRAVTLNPKMAAAYSGRARAYSEIKDFARALADCNTAIANAPNSADYWLRGQTYEALGDGETALADLNEAVRLDRENAGPYADRARLYEKRKDYDRQIASLNEVIRLLTGQGTAQAQLDEASFALALAYGNKGDPDRAIAGLDKLLQRKQDHYAAYSARAGYHVKTGAYDAVVIDATEMIRLQPADAEGYRNRAAAYYHKADFERAIADGNEVIRLSPDSAADYAARGAALYCQKQYDPAIADFDKAMQLRMDDWPSRSLKARALLGLGKTDEARAEIDAGLRMGTGRDRFLSARGELAYTQGEYARALDDYTEAMRLAQGILPADYAGRGGAYEKLGQTALAITDYKTAIEAGAPDPVQRVAQSAARERLSALESEALAAQRAAQQPAEAGRRVALVIGVSAYQNAPALPGATNDAAALAEKLRQLSFTEVIELRDPSRESLEAAVKGFGDKAADADWAVVFYAGHGMQADGRNFLIPADAKLETGSHLDHETVALGEIIESVKGAKKLGLVLLDACRSNPFLKRMQQAQPARTLGQGLAPVAPVPGELIVYAAKDGSAADGGEAGHSPFTKALLEHIGEAGLDIRSMFGKVRDSVVQATQNRQQPSTYGLPPKEDLFFKVAEK